MEYTCIDSFCGAGGLGLGLKRAGFKVLLSFDIDTKCIDTIKANAQYFGHPAEVADIADMLHGNLLEKCNLKRGELFLLAGGPPCQGFSIQRRGQDTDSRNELVLKYGQLIDELYPLYFVMENVSGLGGKRGKTILESLIEKAQQIGYTVHVKLLDAQEYGVPQRRKRYIIVGERNNVHTHYEYPKTSDERHTVRQTIGNLPTPPLDGKDYPSIPLHRRDILNGVLDETDVLIVPGYNKGELLKEDANDESIAPESRLGLGARGCDIIKRFTERGGRLIVWQSSCEWAIELLHLPVLNGIAQEIKLPLPRFSAEYTTKGSSLHVTAEHDTLTMGCPSEMTVLHDNGPVFIPETGYYDFPLAPRFKTVLRFKDDNLLSSGICVGEKMLKGKTCLARVPCGNGEVMMYGFDPQFRSQAEGMFKLLFNALYV